jgi:putative SOS response-associated peptidase YedK
VCGRFNVHSTPGLKELLVSLGVSAGSIRSGLNIAPTESVSLLRHCAGADAVFHVEVREARWWLTPHWAKDLSQKYAMFNARCEGLSKSPAFRKPFASQRGIVPMSSFIEWRGSKGSKQPWLISNEQEAIAVAALWDVWLGAENTDSEGQGQGQGKRESRPLLSCTLVTTAAAPSFQAWHSRMPVMLSPGDRERWLDNSHAIADDDPLFAPRLREPLRLLPIDRAVGNARNKDPGCLGVTGESVTLRAD